MVRKNKLRLVLVHCLKSRNSSPHVGLMCLAAYVRDRLPFVEVSIVEEIDPISEVLILKPDIVGFTADTIAISNTINLAKIIKKKLKVPLIIGGVHITACPDTFDNIFDVGVIGEGEITLEELLKLYQLKRKFAPSDLNKIDGLIYKYNGKNIRSKNRSLIKNLDSLPFPARDLISFERDYFSKQVNLFWVKRMVTVMTSRGCPYHCIYCGSPVQWGSVRLHSAEYIVREIEQLIDLYKVDGVTFSDDLFIFPKERLLKLVEMIKERGWERRITFTGFGRANMMDEDICRALKTINTRKLTFGFESYSEKMLAYLKDHSVFVRDNVKAIKLCHKFGIAVASGLIVGTPGETVEDLETTLAIMKRYPMDNTQIYILTPYPGTFIWSKAEKEGLVSLDMDMNKLFVQIPLSASLKFWKTDKFDFLKNRVFLNDQMKNNKNYMEMILKINLVAWYQNMWYYFKSMRSDPGLVWRIIKSSVFSR